MSEEFDKLVILNERNRCIKCKKRVNDMITCGRCKELRYCSILCLEDDRDAHIHYCNIIGIRKGLLTVIPDDVAERINMAKERARLLNDDGSERTIERPPNKVENSDNSLVNDHRQRSNQKHKTRRNKKKNNNQRNGHKQVKNSNKNGIRDEGHDGKACEGKPEEVLLAGGRFGEAIPVGLKVESGESFGKGWWKPKVKISQAGGSSKEARPEHSVATGKVQGLKNNDFSYSDSEDEDKDKKDEPKKATSVDHEPKKTTEEDHEPKKATGGDQKPKKATKENNGSASASASAASFTEAESGLELVRYDPKREEEERNRYARNQGKCHYCKKEGFVFKCSRCNLASYCNKTCQKNHYQEHKEVCRRKPRYDEALAKVPLLMKMAITLLYGHCSVSPLLRDIPNVFTQMMFDAKTHVMVEILDEHPNPFRHGAIVRDLIGQVTQVLFYTETNFYTREPFPLFALNFPIHLSRCIRPGNFLLIFNVCWHDFLDGTRGIRIDDMEDVKFIFMEN